MNGDGIVFIDPGLALGDCGVGFNELPYKIVCAPPCWDMAQVKSCAIIPDKERKISLVLDQRWGIPFTVEYFSIEDKSLGNFLGWFIPFP
ncbi:MAG: hypothetical protein Q7R84_01145 [bacterium]|nr:hypothetical protein [bacterium]